MHAEWSGMNVDHPELTHNEGLTTVSKVTTRESLVIPLRLLFLNFQEVF